MSTQSGAACTTTSLASRQRLTTECATCVWSTRHDTVGDEGTPELVVTLRDPNYPLQVQLHFRLFEDLDLLEHDGLLPSVLHDGVALEQVLSSAWHLPRGVVLP
jgi:hypothetical protein